MDTEDAAGGNGWQALLARARAAGLRTNLELVTLDPPPRIVDVARPCLPLPDTIVINELEAGALTGIEAAVPCAGGLVDWTRLERIALTLVALGVSTLAVVHFPAGCVAAAPDGTTWRQGRCGFRDQVHSTAGAGDAFAAGVLLGLHEDLPVEQCLRLGAASAGMCVRSATTSAGIRSAAACLVAAAHDGYRTTEPDAAT